MSGLRHEALYAAASLRPGARAWTTDVCVPISRLAECIVETKKDNAGASFPISLVGHAGDGNFHLIYIVDPNRPEEIAEARHLNDRLVLRALAAPVRKLKSLAVRVRAVGVRKLKSAGFKKPTGSKRK